MLIRIQDSIVPRYGCAAFSRTEIMTGDASNSRLLAGRISSKKLPVALDIPSIIRQNGG